MSRPLLHTASLALLLVLSGPAFAQALEVPESESFALDGPSGTYEITVTRPVGYDATSPERYPVLYYLDAWWLREMVTGVALVASLHQKTDVEPVVLVGIGFDGDVSAWSMQRYLDLTPGLYQSPFNGLDLPVGGVWLDSTNTGAADAFLLFLESDVLPRVEADTHVDPERRGLLGHSLGGLFGAWVLGHRPDLFDSYLILSPSMWWRKGEVLDRGFAEAGRLDRRAFAAVGTSEGATMVRGVRELADALVDDSVAVVGRSYPKATHGSVLPRAIWDGFEALYGNETLW